jgi:Brp/Blh family beta-carotene 15,15'-monooxygenase
LLRFLFLVAGLFLYVVNRYFYPISAQEQEIVLCLGVIILGIPHGSADQLIALKNSRLKNCEFSDRKFTVNYLGSIALFSALLYFVPVVGITVFLLLAAYHFGETDLRNLNSQTLLGRIFFFAYGVLILGIILLPNASTVLTGINSVRLHTQDARVVHWIIEHNLTILKYIAALFVFVSIPFFLKNTCLLKHNWIQLVQLLPLLILLYKLPLILSFSFYFVIWHSIFSLKDILSYLFDDKSVPAPIAVKEVLKNSLIALAGILVLGCAGFFFLNKEDIVLYIVLGLAVLTAPHMQIIHQMYNHLKAPSLK